MSESYKLFEEFNCIAESADRLYPYIEEDLPEAIAEFSRLTPLVMLYAQADSFEKVLEKSLDFPEVLKELAAGNLQEMAERYIELQDALKENHALESKLKQWLLINWFNPDMEDAVPDEKKQETRALLQKSFPFVKEFFDRVRQLRSEYRKILSVRPNKLGTIVDGIDQGEEDLKAFTGLVDLYLLPKHRNGAELQNTIAACERYENGKKMPFFMIIENEEAFQEGNIDALIGNERVVGAVVGIQDLLLDHLLQHYFVEKDGQYVVDERSFQSVGQVRFTARQILQRANELVALKAEEYGKIFVASSSFSDRFEATSHEDFACDEKAQGRTMINPGQVPSNVKVPQGSRVKQEVDFFDVDIWTLATYLEKVCKRKTPGYFAVGDPHDREGRIHEEWPNLMGKPIAKRIALFLRLYLCEKDCSEDTQDLELYNFVQEVLELANEKIFPDIKIGM